MSFFDITVSDLNDQVKIWYLLVFIAVAAVALLLVSRRKK